MPLFLGLVAGVYATDASLWSWLGCGAALLLVFTLTRRITKTAAGLVLLFAGLGFVRAQLAWRWIPADHLLHAQVEDGSLVRLRARISDDVQANQFLIRDETAPAAAAPPSSRIEIEVSELSWADGQWRPCSGRALLRSVAALDCRYGDEVEITGRLRRLSNSGNPGGFDAALYYERENIRHQLFIQSPEQVVLLARPQWTVVGLFHNLRDRLTGVLARHLDGEDLALYATVLLGNRTMMQESMRDAFVQSGTMHLLAISGLHLMFWVAGVLWLGRVLRLPESGRVWSALVFAGAYALLVGPRGPVLRAFIMVMAWGGGILLYRRGNILNSLALAALAVLLLHPEEAWRPGFYLSFGAVLGIVLFSDPLQRVLNRADPAQAEIERLTGRKSRFGDLRRFFFASLIVSASCFVMIWPVTWYCFNVIAPLGIAANVLGVLGLVCALGCGTLLLLSGLLLPPLAPVLAAMAVAFSALLIRQAQTFSAIDWGHVYLPEPSLALVLGYYALVLYAALSRRRGRAKWMPCLAMVLALIAGGWIHFQRVPPEETTVTMLNVGSGACIVLEGVDGSVILYDCGSTGFADMGSQVVAPFLWHRGLARVDLLILSHEDADHVNGMVGLARRVRIGKVIVTPQFAGSEQGARHLEALRAAPGFHGEIAQAVAGDVLHESGGYRLVALHPAPDFAARNRNDESLLTRLEYGRSTFLLTGDLEAEGFARVPPEARRADVLQVPHHGSAVDGYAALLDSIAPAIGVVSTRFPELRPDVAAEYARRGVDVYCTESAGAIELRFAADGGCTVQTFGGAK